jgi:hypothetical protein
MIQTSSRERSQDPSRQGIYAFYQSCKAAIFPKVRLGYERLKQFFRLPGCYRRVRAMAECTRSGPGVARDLLTWFFAYKTFPDHYGLCRLWEVDRSQWKYYFTSNYHPHQLARLKRFVQPLEYRILFNDKFICALLCQALDIRIPKTYGVIEPAQDYRSRITAWLSTSSAKGLIVKPLFGEMGRDIVKIETGPDGIVARSRQGIIALGDFILEEKALVQDVLDQDPRLAVFSPASVNTLRVVTMLTSQEEVLIVNASFRSGVGAAFVDNWSAGGVSVGVDCAKGTLKKFAYNKQSRRFTAHPTSGIVFEGYPVPEWGRVRAAAAAIQRAFPFYRLIGLDMALNASGDPVLIEANGAPDLAGLEQKTGPLLKSGPVLKAFGEYGLLFNKAQRRLYASLAQARQANGDSPGLDD